MTYFCFRNTPFKGVYKDINVYKDIINLFPDASYRKFQKKEDKEDALKWAGVSKLTKTKDYKLTKSKLKLEKTKEVPVSNSIDSSFEIENYDEFIINESIKLIKSEYDGYIISGWDSYDSSSFLNKEMKELYQAYEIHENNNPTGIVIYFYCDYMDCIELLLIPDEHREIFNLKYKNILINEELENKNDDYVPFEIRTMNCLYCHGQGCIECY